MTGFLRGELGAHLTPSVSLFGFGEATLSSTGLAPPTPAWLAGIGGRFRW